MDIRERSLKKHYECKGKIEVISGAPINTREDLSLAYTQGVSAPNVVTPEMVKSMAADAVIFPTANPTPKIMPDVAKAVAEAVVKVVRETGVARI